VMDLDATAKLIFTVSSLESIRAQPRAMLSDLNGPHGAHHDTLLKPGSPRGTV